MNESCYEKAKHLQKQCKYYRFQRFGYANKDVSLGILGLNEDFVQLNEIMDYLNSK